MQHTWLVHYAFIDTDTHTLTHTTHTETQIHTCTYTNPLLLEFLEDLPQRIPPQPDLVVMPQGKNS